jgi:hypothetical protein
MKNLSILIVLLFMFGFFYSGCHNENNPVENGLTGNTVTENNLTKDNPIENDLTGDNLSKHTIRWRVPGDFATIHDAMVSPNVLNGHKIIVGPGKFAGADITKSVIIEGNGKTVINDGFERENGLKQGFKLMVGSDGAKLSNLTFTTDFGITSDPYSEVNNITIAHCTFLNAVMAIENNGGNSWNIQHNKIRDLRRYVQGGVGIFIYLTDYLGGKASYNVISHNTISGTLHVNGYSGMSDGILIVANFGYGVGKPIEITKNYITHNSIRLVSENPSLVDVSAIELVDTRDDKSQVAIFKNTIAFNDLRGTANQISFTPIELKQFNYIYGNLGDNRGHHRKHYPGHGWHP